MNAGQDLEDRWADWQASAAATDSARNMAVITVASAIVLATVLTVFLAMR